MRRLIAITAVTASLALSAFAMANGGSILAKEGELRNGADDTHIQLVGREGELRNGLDNVTDDKVVARGEAETEPVQPPQPEPIG